MQQPLLRRLVVTALGLGALFTALVASSASVGAAVDPAVFTNNGCDVGNYACLEAAQPNVFTSYGCDIGNYSCLYSATGYPTYQYRYPYYAAPIYPYAYQYPYTYSYVVYLPPTTSTTPPPTTTTATGTIVSGYAAPVGQQVTTNVTGFTPGEQVTAAVTGPKGVTAVIGSAPAAADGSVTVYMTFPTRGTWLVTLKGQSSYRTVANLYQVQ
jgi:hypothetical protein